MRVYNFSAGPSMLPAEVLEEAQRELLDFAGTGMSVTEISHRDKAYSAVVEEAERNLRDLLKIIASSSYRAARASSSRRCPLI